MIFLFVVSMLCRNYSILINTSKGYINYRHMSNIQILYEIFKRDGIPEDNIFTVFQDDPHQDARNPDKDRIYFMADECIEKCRMKNRMHYRYLTENVILDIINLKNERLKSLDENDNIVIYMCGHGREGFFKVCDRYFIFKNDLMDILQGVSKRINNLLLILDTCQASTLLDERHIPANVTVVTTSLDNEFSYASNAISSLGVYGIDDFPYFLYKGDLDYNLQADEFFKMFTGNLLSTVKVWGNSTVKMSTFFWSNARSSEIKAFVI